jgi:hypothetical protein
MTELPSGTVTFLFTDIEGSTKLLHELGDEYAPVLAEHRRILRVTSWSSFRTKARRSSGAVLGGSSSRSMKP